MKRYLCI